MQISQVPDFRKMTMLMCFNYLLPNWSQFNREKNVEELFTMGPGHLNINLGAPASKPRLPYLEMRIYCFYWPFNECTCFRIIKMKSKDLLICSNSNTVEHCSQSPPTPGTISIMRE